MIFIHYDKHNHSEKLSNLITKEKVFFSSIEIDVYIKGQKTNDLEKKKKCLELIEMMPIGKRDKDCI